MTTPSLGANALMAQADAAEREPEATPIAEPNAPRGFPMGTGVVPSQPIPRPQIGGPPSINELMAEADAAEHADVQGAHQILGEAAVMREQDGYAQQISAQPPAPFTYTTADKIRDVAADVGHRIAEVPEGVYSGVVHAAGELTTSALSVLNAGNPVTMLWHLMAAQSIDPKLKQVAQGVLDGQDALTKLPEKGADAITPTLDTGLGETVKSVTQFVAGFIPVVRGLKLAGAAERLGTFGTNVLAGATTQAAAFNPDDPRLSNLIQAHPSLANPVNAFLATKPGDTDAEGRLKNFLEGGVLSAAGDGVIEGFGSVLKAMRASGSLADNTKALADAKGTPVAHSSPQPAPEVTPEEAAQPAPVLKPYEPPTIEKADTANPSGNTAETQKVADEAAKEAAAVAPKPATGEPVEAPAPSVFDPPAVAKDILGLTPESTKTVLGYIADGRYNEIPGVLDDTHRTIPWESLSDGANLKGLFNAVESKFGDVIKQAHGVGPVSDASIVQLAKDIGGNVQSVSKLYGDATSNGGLAARITAGYNIMTASARQLKDLAVTAHGLNLETDAGKQAVLDFQKQLELHAAIVGQVRQSSAEIGRALYAHRSLKASSDVALSNVSDLAGTVLGPKAVKKFVDTVGSSDDLAAITKAADQTRGKGFMGIVKEVAQNGMLSGLPTQVANITGNVTNAVIKTAERYLAGVIGNVRGVLMPDAEVATIRAAVAHTAGIASGFRDSFPLFVRALTTEQAVSASGRPLVRAISRDTTGLTGANLTLAQVINRVGQVVRYPGRFMGAIDNLNMGIGYQADLNARSYTQAATEADAQALQGTARDTFLDNRMAQLRDNPSPEVRAQSMDAGLYQSFQEAARTRFGEGVSSMLNSHPLVKLLFAPFVHRPLNMLRQSLMDYTPLGLTSRTMREALGVGNADTDVALARMTLGTGALAFAYELAGNGQATGSRLGSRNTESLDKIPPYSLKIGDRWFQYNRVDPVGLWLAIGSELHEHMDRLYDPNDPNGNSDLATLTRAAVQVTGAAAMDKSFMQSADQVMQALGSKDPKRGAALVQRLLDSNLFKFVPFSGALRTAAQATDPTPRASGGDGLANLWDSVKANLPGLSQDLPPKRDILGRPLERPAGTSAWWNPFGAGKASADPMDRELSKVAVNVETPPRQLEGFVLSPHDYDDVIQRATQSPIFPGGTNLEGYMRLLTGSPTWASYETTDDHGVMARTKLVQQAVDAAYNYGKQTFVQDHPDFKSAMVTRYEQQAAHFRRAIAAQEAE